MSVVNLGGLSVSKNSYRRARQIVENKQGGTKKTAADVLASLRQMKPGWTIDTSSSNWGPGVRNLEICSDILNRMAEDPDAMVKYKAFILDLEDLVPELEKWAQQNEGKSLDFKFVLDTDGTRAISMVKTLLGGEKRTTFELPNDGSSWAELINQKLAALNEGRAESADGSSSWLG
ncbi:MAG: hypothetical protein FWC91_01670 [Defluviitaleaceae bacterium]|nr:hypothetical protein [Defluviitaleaceae bacterium]